MCEKKSNMLDFVIPNKSPRVVKVFSRRELEKGLIRKGHQLHTVNVSLF
jgi:hypothetical protein